MRSPWQNLSMGWVRRVLGKTTKYPSAHALIELHKSDINKERLPLPGDVACWDTLQGNVAIVVMTEPLMVVRLDERGMPEVSEVNSYRGDYLGTFHWDEP